MSGTTHPAVPMAQLMGIVARVVWGAMLLVVLPSAAAAQSNSSRGCQPVSGVRLEGFYPSMPGWKRGTPTSETDPAEQVGRTTVDFDRKTETISVEIMDSC